MQKYVYCMEEVVRKKEDKRKWKEARRRMGGHNTQLSSNIKEARFFLYISLLSSESCFMSPLRSYTFGYLFQFFLSGRKMSLEKTNFFFLGKNNLKIYYKILGGKLPLIDYEWLKKGDQQIELFWCANIFRKHFLPELTRLLDEFEVYLLFVKKSDLSRAKKKVTTWQNSSTRYSLDITKYVNLIIMDVMQTSSRATFLFPLRSKKIINE